MPNKHNASCRHHIPKMKFQVKNWAEYDAGLRRRGSLTLWVTPEVLDGWQAARRTTPGGQSSYSELAIETGMMLRLAFHLALRQTEGLMASIFGLLGVLLSTPDHSTLSRRARKMESISKGCILPDGPIHFEIYNSRRPYSWGTDARPGILPPSARSCGGVTRDEDGGGNVKIDETDFHISTARTTTEQVFT
jgi:hypothetical protein